MINQEIEKLLKDGITEAELNKYRNQWHLQRLFSSEITSKVNERAINVLSIHNRIISVEEELKVIDALTVNDINQVIKKYLTTENVITVIVGK